MQGKSLSNYELSQKILKMDKFVNKKALQFEKEREKARIEKLKNRKRKKESIG
ncbi:hypothetical protein JXA27_07055 [Aerococcaceae bacterium zg-B36]|uniref:hypothetical protein n=1 Tax=Aerococcaceae bacterium zg-252 TaxID=2796928 RepID=UPI001BD865A4|nr:hypothetical protein [Aerococcaceae bacterium zg-B36]